MRPSMDIAPRPRAVAEVHHATRRRPARCAARGSRRRRGLTARRRGASDQFSAIRSPSSSISIHAGKKRSCSRAVACPRSTIPTTRTPAPLAVAPQRQPRSKSMDEAAALDAMASSTIRRDACRPRRSKPPRPRSASKRRRSARSGVDRCSSNSSPRISAPSVRPRAGPTDRACTADRRSDQLTTITAGQAAQPVCESLGGLVVIGLSAARATSSTTTHQADERAAEHKDRLAKKRGQQKDAARAKMLSQAQPIRARSRSPRRGRGHLAAPRPHAARHDSSRCATRRTTWRCSPTATRSPKRRSTARTGEPDGKKDARTASIKVSLEAAKPVRKPREPPVRCRSNRRAVLGSQTGGPGPVHIESTPGDAEVWLFIGRTTRSSTSCGRVAITRSPS